MSVALRPVTEGDQPFLLELYAATRLQELAGVPWPPEQKEAFVQTQFIAQSRHYESQHPHSTHHVLLWAGEAVGRLWVDCDSDAIHILDLTISPAACGRGIGATVLRGLLAEGARAGRPVTIYLEGPSPAVRLFERLGFTKVAEQQGYHHLYRWRAVPAPASAVN